MCIMYYEASSVVSLYETMHSAGKYNNGLHYFNEREQD